jgi:hypothetical protein
MADPSFVQVSPDSTGKKIRNIQADVLQPDGTFATVQMQVVSIVDSDGRTLDLEGSKTRSLLKEILNELQAIRRMQGRATGQHWSGLGDAMTDGG